MMLCEWQFACDWVVWVFCKSLKELIMIIAFVLCTMILCPPMEVNILFACIKFAHLIYFLFILSLAKIINIICYFFCLQYNIICYLVYIRYYCIKKMTNYINFSNKKILTLYLFNIHNLNKFLKKIKPKMFLILFYIYLRKLFF